MTLPFTGQAPIWNEGEPCRGISGRHYFLTNTEFRSSSHWVWLLWSLSLLLTPGIHITWCGYPSKSIVILETFTLTSSLLPSSPFRPISFFNSFPLYILFSIESSSDAEDGGTQELWVEERKGRDCLYR